MMIKIKLIRIISRMTAIGLLCFGGVAFAEENPVATSSISSRQMINLAGKQRMLSQRMAKDYFYAGKKINKSNALKQLKNSLRDFKTTQILLNRKISNDEIKNLIAFVNMSLDEFVEISGEKYSVDNGTIILDLSESMLEGSEYVVQALTEGKASSEIVDIAGKERMLSQRIAKYYIAYQAGIKDDNTIVQMKETVKEFDTILKRLIANKSNTLEIKKELAKVNRMWNIVYKFYLNIEKGGLPIIVFSTTDDITKKMNKVVGIYVNTLEKK
ncbi:MAG: hypothetical protein DRG30_08660 [Epsilonproteobacteria bacterium]|nr:MAG: hypothetical protein DRG30_08660 [Campylobacterota bacterium]